MESTALIHRANRALVDRRASKRFAGALILATIGFNAALCYLNTHGFVISEFHVVMSEALLISAAALACLNYLNPIHVSVLALTVFFTVALSTVRYVDVPVNGFDPKISRDLIIPIVFYLLGKAVNDVRAADKIVFTATFILLVFAVFEYFLLDAFLNVFNVAEYYIARGTLVASEWARETSQGLMISGIRPADQGRTLLPFLGDHRVSSLFLEPSTLGNFGVVVTLWAVVRSRMEGRLYIWSAFAGLALLILSDTRFDAYFLVLAVVTLMLPTRLTTPALFILPFVTILALCFFAASAGPYDGIPMVEGRGIYDRLLYSGRVLQSFDIYHWFGLETWHTLTHDSGYSYVLSNVGIMGLAAFWILFMSLKGSSRFFYSFRNVMALYFVALLCISASQFTIKLAAILWFLLGVLSVAKDTYRRTSPSRNVGTSRLTALAVEPLWRSSPSLGASTFHR